jgi:hypothetical protein
MTDKQTETEATSNTVRGEETTGRTLRSNPAPLDRYRLQILSWLNGDKCSDQQCCERLKKQFNLECSPKLIAVHRRHWALEDELDASANQIHKTLEFTAQAMAGLEPAAGMMSQAIPILLESRFINAAMNPATTDQTLERLARMIQLFRKMALKREELDLRRMVEKNNLALFESAQRSRTTHQEPNISVLLPSPTPTPLPSRPASAPASASVPFDTLPKSSRSPHPNPTLAEALAKDSNPDAKIALYPTPKSITANYH